MKKKNPPLVLSHWWCLSPSSSSEESEYSDDVSPFYIPGFTQTFIVPSGLTSESSSDDEYYHRRKRVIKHVRQSLVTALTANTREFSRKAAR